MLFNTWSYILFLTFASLLLRVKFIPWRISLAILSISFYAFWDYRFLPLIFIVTTVDYFAARIIENTTKSQFKNMALAFSVSINLSFLIFFKYILLLLYGMEASFGYIYTGGILHSIILPLGISFYTFEAISYVIDVYRGEKKAEQSYLSYMLFILFFPKLIAGPIMRAGQLLPQLQKRPEVNHNDIRVGLNTILNGLFLKVVLADNISPVVDAAFEVNPSLLGFLDVSTMGFLFGWQIYFDFFGYSLIALGSARVLGIRLIDNFKDPYISFSVKEFWTRWHISLSQWIKDYLYVPLIKLFFGDTRPSGLNFVALGCLFISWSIMGMWHGSNLSFLIWGLMHAVYLLIFRLNEKIIPIKIYDLKIFQFLSLCLTLYVVMIAWVPFRAIDANHSIELLSALLSTDNLFSLGFREDTYLITFLVTVGYFIYYKLVDLWKVKNISLDFCTLVFKLTLTFIYLQAKDQFIYFQF